MCSSLCNPRNKHKKFDVYRLVGCYNYDEPQDSLLHESFEFKTVLVYEITNKRYITRETPERLVLKSAHKSFYDFDTHIDTIEFEKKSLNEQLKFLVSLIRTSLESSYDIMVDNAMINWLKIYLKDGIIKESNDDKDLFYYVKKLSVNNNDFFELALKNSDRMNMAKFIQNLALLMSQDEYLFARLFAEKNHTLNVYGTCGHIYAIEHAESLGNCLSKLFVPFSTVKPTIPSNYLIYIYYKNRISR